MNILCIEPDVVLAGVYKKIFVRPKKDQITFCLDPQSAIEKVEQVLPDCIVMELQLAPISGIAFLHELRSYQDLIDIPVVIYSSIPQESFNAPKKVWQTLGIEAYFYKATDSPSKVANCLWNFS